MPKRPFHQWQLALLLGSLCAANVAQAQSARDRTAAEIQAAQNRAARAKIAQERATNELLPNPPGAGAHASPLNRPSTNAAEKATPPTGISKDVKIPDTVIELDVILPSRGNAVDAQRWGQLFQKQKVEARIRQGGADERADIKETVLANRRTVKLVGLLDGEGKLRFPRKTFSLAEPEKVADWINELRLYGAQGAPEGKPAWGLNRDQFTGVFDALAKVHSTETHGQPLANVLSQLPLEGLKLNWSATAQAAVPKLDGLTVKNELKGFSAGTSLALILGEQNLAFKPSRTPAGSLELLVQPREELKDGWPIGWPLDGPNPGAQFFPDLYKVQFVGFDDLPLDEILAGITQVTATPMLIDFGALQKQGVDLHKIKQTQPRKQSSWGAVLDHSIRSQWMMNTIKLDDAGNPFMFIYPFIVEKPKAK